MYLRIWFGPGRNMCSSFSWRNPQRKLLTATVWMRIPPSKWLMYVTISIYTNIQYISGFIQRYTRISLQSYRCFTKNQQQFQKNDSVLMLLWCEPMSLLSDSSQFFLSRMPLFDIIWRWAKNCQDSMPLGWLGPDFDPETTNGIPHIDKLIIILPVNIQAH